MDILEFSYKGYPLFKIQDNGHSLDDIYEIKKELAKKNAVHPDDIDFDLRETPSLPNSEYFISQYGGSLMFAGTFFNTEMIGVRMLIDISTEEGMNNFLDQYQGDIMKILVFKPNSINAADYCKGK